MRNDARPIGGDASHQSPVVGDRTSHSGPRSEVVNHESGIYRPRPESPVDDKEPVLDFDADDQVMPANDSTLNTKI
jgi:hypothetical protein